jgi:hypothetical protein
VSGDVKVLGAVVETTTNIGAISWNGTTFTVIGASTISEQTGRNSEFFDLEFKNY